MTSLRRRSRQGDKGAALVEAAIVLPLLFLFIFGIMETGSFMKSRSAASNAVRAAGRSASVAGNNTLADQIVLRSVEREIAGIDEADIEYIVFWHSRGPGSAAGYGRPPANCIPSVQSTPNTGSIGQNPDGSGGPGACNIYHRPGAPGGAFDMADPDVNDGASQPPAYYFGCTNPATEGSIKVDCNWQSRVREVLKSPRGATGTVTRPDYFGVHVRAQHRTVTGILGDTFTITEDSVYLLEPQGYRQ